MTPMRRPVAAYVRVVEQMYGSTPEEVIVCDDGAVFWRVAGGGGEWKPDRPVPGTVAEQANAIGKQAEGGGA